MNNEYQEWEELRREVAEVVDMTEQGSLLNKFFRWCLNQIEKAQKEIINERFGR